MPLEKSEEASDDDRLYTPLCARSHQRSNFAKTKRRCRRLDVERRCRRVRRLTIAIERGGGELGVGEREDAASASERSLVARFCRSPTR